MNDTTDVEHLRSLAECGAPEQVWQRWSSAAGTTTRKGSDTQALWRILAEARAHRPHDAPREVHALLYDRMTALGLPVRPRLALPSLGALTGSTHGWQPRLDALTRLVWQRFVLQSDGAFEFPPLHMTFTQHAAKTWNDADGASADLALALDIFSVVTAMKPRQTTCASGTLVSEVGGAGTQVGTVQDLAAKVRGAVAELGPHVDDLLVLVPRGQDAELATAAHDLTNVRLAVKAVDTLDQAIELAFGCTAAPVRADEARLVHHLLREADRAQHERGDNRTAKRLLAGLDDAALARASRLLAAERGYRLCALETHAGNATAHFDAFAAHLETARTAIRNHQLDTAELRHYAKAALVYEVAALNERAPQQTVDRLERALAEHALDGVPLGPELRVEVLGTLAIATAIAGDDARAVQLREQAIELTSEGGSRSRFEAQRSYSHLGWEAARAGDAKRSETALLEAARRADNPRDAAFVVYNRLRALEREGERLSARPPAHGATGLGMSPLAYVVMHATVGNPNDPVLEAAPLVREAFAALWRFASEPSSGADGAPAYPGLFALRPLARGLVELADHYWRFGRHFETTRRERAVALLELGLAALEGHTAPVLRWYGQQLELERMLAFDALFRPAQALEARERALRGLGTLHAGLARQHAALIDAVAAWRPEPEARQPESPAPQDRKPAGCDEAVRAELARLYY